jgi:uncharacterized protein YukE
MPEPLERELVFDIAPALGALGQLDAALSASVESFGSDLEAAISAATGDATATVDVEVTADASEAEAAVAAVTEDLPEAEIVVTADTADAETELASLGEQAEATGGSMVALGEASGQAGAVAGIAQGDFSGLSSAVSGISPAAAGAVTALAALAAFTAGAVQQAAEAERAQVRFNRSLGASADAVNNIDIGGLSGTISELAIAVGGTDEKLQLAASRIADLGRSSGASEEQISRASESIVALALHLSATNPALGDAGDIADNLTSALARGGRALAAYGIALSTDQINARAFSETGKAAADELTIFDKAAAGAAIRVEQLGDTLGAEFQDSIELGAIRMASLRTELEETIESLGADLQPGVLALMESGIPIAIELSRILKEFAEAVLPAVPGPLDAIAFALRVVADFLELLPEPVLEIAVAFLALKKTMDVAGAAIGIFSKSLSASLGPIGIAIAVIGAVAFAFDAMGDSSKRAAADADAVGRAVFKQARSIEEVRVALDGLNDAFAVYIEEQADFGQESEFVTERLRDLGIGFDQLREVLIGPEEGIRELAKAMRDTANPFEDMTVDTSDLIEELEQERDALFDAAKAQLAFLLGTGALTQRQVSAATAQNTLADGTVNYVGALEDAVAGAEEVAAAQAVLTEAWAVSHGAVVRLQDAILDGRVTTDNAATAAAQYGLAVETVTGQIDALNAELSELVSSAVSGLPTANDAFATWQAGIETAFEGVKTAAEEDGGDVAAALEGLAAAADPQRLIENLAKQLFAVASFQTNLQTFLDAEQGSLVKFLAEQGPIIGGALAEQLVIDPQAAADLEALLDATAESVTKTQELIAENATLLVTGVAENSRRALAEAKDALHSGGLTDETREAGRIIGDAFGEGIHGGIGGWIDQILRRGREASAAAARGAREQAGIHSPSTVFQEIGEQMVAGLAVGLARVGPLDGALGDIDRLTARLATVALAGGPGVAQAPSPGAAQVNHFEQHFEQGVDPLHIAAEVARRIAP